MKHNVAFFEIVNRLAVVLSNEKLTAEYNQNSNTREGVCGWCGVMSPLTRVAFIEDFGLDAVLLAEMEARKIIQKKAEEYAATAFHRHELEADEHKAAGQPAPTHEGQFVWAVSSCLKGEGGFSKELRALVEYGGDQHEHGPRLCCIEKIITVDSLPMSYADCDAIVTAYGLHGGSRSDDVTDEQINNLGGLWNLPEDQIALFYTVAAAVVDKAGRWYLMDAEGYDYCRYYYSPCDFSQVFASEVSAINAEIAAEKEAEKREQEEAAAARLEAYRQKCQKWENIMEPVAPYEKAEKEAAAALNAIPYRQQKGSKEQKAYKSAQMKLNNCRRRNILAMVAAAFPGLSVSLKKDNGWGADWDLSWQDGPTSEEFSKATDLELFATYGDRFNGMEDYAYTTDYEHTDFARKYMGDHAAEIDTHRNWSNEKRAELVKKHEAAGYDADREAWKEFCATSYFVAPETPVTPDPDNHPCRTEKAVREAENGSGDVPAGLSLVDIEGGVAVVGENWKDTYFHKREIKAHGATWNKEAQQWQATEPEAVAALRAWFGVAADEQPTTADDSHVIESVKNQSSCDQEDSHVSMLRAHYSLNYDNFHELKDRWGLRQSIVFFRYTDHCELYGWDASTVAPWLNRKPVAPTDPHEGTVLFYALSLDTDLAYIAEDLICKKGLQVVYTDGLSATDDPAPDGSPSKNSETPVIESVKNQSPVMKQFTELKEKHPDALFLFRCGDFYELYAEDAEKVCPILEITLTTHKDGYKMAAFPYHALDTYLPKLVRKGYRLAICDQLEDPRLTRKLVKRGITEMVTPASPDKDQEAA